MSMTTKLFFVMSATFIICDVAFPSVPETPEDAVVPEIGVNTHYDSDARGLVSDFDPHYSSDPETTDTKTMSEVNTGAATRNSKRASNINDAKATISASRIVPRHDRMHKSFFASSPKKQVGLPPHFDATTPTTSAATSSSMESTLVRISEETFIKARVCQERAAKCKDMHWVCPFDIKREYCRGLPGTGDDGLREDCKRDQTKSNFQDMKQHVQMQNYEAMIDKELTTTFKPRSLLEEASSIPMMPERAGLQMCIGTSEYLAPYYVYEKTAENVAPRFLILSAEDYNASINRRFLTCGLRSLLVGQREEVKTTWRGNSKSLIPDEKVFSQAKDEFPIRLVLPLPVEDMLSGNQEVTLASGAPQDITRVTYGELCGIAEAMPSFHSRDLQLSVYFPKPMFSKPQSIP